MPAEDDGEPSKKGSKRKPSGRRDLRDAELPEIPCLLILVRPAILPDSRLDARAKSRNGI